MIEFLCPSCQKRLRLTKLPRSESATCPACQTEFSISQAIDQTSVEQVTDHEEESSSEVEVPQTLSRSKFSIDHDELIDMTAMVDIVFFLLIYFLVTSFQGFDSAIPMPVPDAQAAQGSGTQSTEPTTVEEFEEDDEYIVVHLDQKDQIDVDGKTVYSLQELARELREQQNSASHPDKLLVIGHGDSSHGLMVSVLDIGHDAGLKRVRMLITDTNEE